MSEIQSSSSCGDEEEYNMSDEDEDEANKSGVPRAASPSSSSTEDEGDCNYTSAEALEEEIDVLEAAYACTVRKKTCDIVPIGNMSDVQSSGSSDDGRDWSDYFHTSDEDDENEDVKSPESQPTSHFSGSNEDGEGEEEEEELDVLGAAAVSVRKETCQIHNDSVTGLDQLLQSGIQLTGSSVDLPSGIRHRKKRNSIQVNYIKQQFGDVNVGKATNVNQSFGGSQNISKTATFNEGHKAKANNINKRTISHFQSWNQGMVRTAALDQVLDKLKSGTTWLTIKGNPGEGKTTVGYMTLEELHRCGRKVFKVRTPDEFTEVIETCSCPVIMLDDVFGNFEFDQAKWAIWEPVICPLLKEREHKSHEKEDKTSMRAVTVILIGRDHVMNAASIYLGRLFDLLTLDQCVVHMDHSLKRSTEEKRAIWKTISRSRGLKLDSQTVDEILRIEVPHGFPHVCRLFTTLFKENQALNAVEFFNKPLNFLHESVSMLLRDTSTLSLFKQMVIGEGKISEKEVARFDETYKIKEKADNLVGTYIKVEEDDYVFDHASIFDSVALQLCSKDPGFVIKHCNLSFIYERVRISSSKNRRSKDSSKSNIVANVNSSFADDLAERFAAEIEARNFVYVLSHDAFRDGTFVSKVMSRIKTPLKALLHLDDKKYVFRMEDTDKAIVKLSTFLSLVPSTRSPELLKYIDSCPDIALTKDDDNTILYWTCRNAASDVLEYLINTRKSLDVNNRYELDKTLLMIAAETGNFNCVEQILSLTPDLTARDSLGRTMVHYFSQSGLVSALTKMIDCGFDIDAQDCSGKSPLSYACEHNQIESVQLLIEKGARVDEDVVCSACRSGNLKLVKMLFKNNASLSTNSTLNACLSAASEGGDTDIMKFLVDKGASVNAYGYFPLHAASSKNKTQAIKWLLQQGADIDRTDSRGNTALHAATCARFASEECVEVLLKAFAKVDTTNEDGNTALHCAVNPLYCHPNKSVCQKLIKKGVSVNMQNRGGETPLHLLCLSYNSSENGDSNVYRELAQIIIDRGASIDIKDELDEPALHGELKQLLKGSESAQEGENVCQICLCLVLFILFFHFAGIYVLIQADGDLLSVTSRLV